MHQYRAAPRWLLTLALTGCAAVAPAPADPPAPEQASVTATADVYQLPDLPTGEPVSASEYASRREALAAEVGDGVLLVLGSRAPAADYLPYQQTPAFQYLTGITEPDAALVIIKNDGDVTERLFVRPRNPSREVWEGARLGADGAELLTGISSAPVSALVPVLDSLLADGGTLYTNETLADGPDPLATRSPEQQIIAQLAARNPGVGIVPIGSTVQTLRGAKSATELDLIRRAVNITVVAQRAAMRAIEPGMNEFEIQALIEYTFRRNGADGSSFSTIVGSGPNATTLHYRADDRYMEPADMVVMDIGASYRGYAADITRSVPVSGTFSPEQREIYGIVLEAQKAAESLVRPGATWLELGAAVDDVLAAGLAELGLIDAPYATYDCGPEGSPALCPQFRLFYMHGLGHGIGLQVHDPDVSFARGFQLGSAFTIEPGLYIRSDALAYLPDTPANRELIRRLRPAVVRYENIGVRIEDDYFLASNGLERVSAGAPREIAEIEVLMNLPSLLTAERLPAVVDWYGETDWR